MDRKIFVALDSFKGSLSTFEANGAVKEALLEMGIDSHEIKCFPMSDGGEGFSDVYSSYTNSRKISIKVLSPFGDRIIAYYHISDNNVAIIESATACGYTLVPIDKKNPLILSSFGVGEMIKDAISRGAKKIIIGLGGTSTNDGGVGMLQALGVKFATEKKLLQEGEPALLKRIISIDKSSLISINVEIDICVDTQAFFFGENGAVKIYGPQKGLQKDCLNDADEWMRELWHMYYPDNQMISGSGAAGGIAGALSLLPNSHIKSGASEILSISKFKELCNNEETQPSLVITGEGKFDSQTLTGKLPYIIAQSCGGAKKICVAGKIDNSTKNHPFDYISQITPNDMPLDVAIQKDVAVKNLKRAILSLP